jgi:aminotransferase in exopolysaccharide biosynthesis
MKKCNIDNTIDFIRSVYNTEGDIYLHEPRFVGNEKNYLLETIDSTFVSSVGPFVDQYEEQISKLTDTKRAVAVANGTCALQISLELAGVKSEDEVLTQALTFVATANSISYLKATPIFIDVDLDTMGLSPKALKEFLEQNVELKDDGSYNKKTGKKISACMPMHTFGFMCRIDEIVEICNQWKISVVEDAAEALGSKYKGKSSGSFGLLGAFSLNGNKIITSGGGGAITTNNIAIGDKAKHLTTTAKVPHKWEYTHDKLGYNFRLPNLNAALACAQLEQLDNMKNSKKTIFNQYKDFFHDTEINIVDIPKNTDWNYWLTSILLKNKKERDVFLEETNKQGIMTRPIWTLMYRLPMYKKVQRDSQKNAEYLEQRIVNLPSSAIL